MISSTSLTVVAVAISTCVVYRCIFVRKEDPVMEAKRCWNDLMGSDDTSAHTFKRLGGNSTNYKVTNTVTGEAYFLKIREGSSSNLLVRWIFDRKLLERQFNGDHFAWTQVCTRLLGKCELGAKYIAGDAKAMVTEFVTGIEFGSEEGFDPEWTKNEAAMRKFGRYLAQMGKVSKAFQTDAEAREMGKIVMSSGNPWNLADVAKTFSACPERLTGYPSVSYYKQELLKEWDAVNNFPPVPSPGYGSELIFVHSDAHAGNFLWRENGEFLAIDLEMGSIQPAAHLLYNIIWTGAGLSMTHDEEFEARKRRVRHNIVSGYLMEVSDTTESDLDTPEFQSQLEQLLFEVEYYKNRVEVITFGMVSRHMLRLFGFTSTTGLLLWLVMPRLKKSRELLLEALYGTEDIRRQVAQKGIETILNERSP